MKWQIFSGGPQRPSGWLSLWSYVASTIVLSSCLIALYFGLQPTVERWLVERWENQLAELPEPLAASVMADVATQGDWGLRLLTTATLTTNEPAQQAACRELELQLERWAVDSTADHSADIVRVTAFLAEHLHQYNETQQRELRPLVQRLTNWPINRQRADAARFVADCETLARRVAEIRLASVALSPAKKVFPALTNQEPPPPPPPTAVPPVDENSSSTPPSPAVSPPAAPETSADPELILEMLPSSPEGIRRLPSRSPRRIENRPTRPTTDVREHTSDQPVALLGNERLDMLTDWEVITRFYDPDVNPQSVEAELIRRGYQARDIAIAKRAAHPEVAVRRQLIEDLPQIKGIDARLWLRQLGLDPAAEVRNRANAVLRTAGESAALQTRM